MEIGFGARLRLQREQQGVTLRTIADRTKIKLSLLEGLERDDLSQWPAGIFRRSYFREYAQAIGLDPESSVREFLERYPDPNAADPFPAEARSSTGSGNRPPTRLRYLIDSAVGVLPARRSHTPISAPAADLLVPDEIELREPTRSPAGADAFEPLIPGLVEPFSLSLGEPLSLFLAESLVPAPVETLAPTAADDAEPGPPSPLRVDFAAVAHLCTRLARVVEARELAPVVEDAVTILDAVGVILWIWNPRWRALSAALAHGYPEELLRQLSRVPDHGETAIAVSFRSGETLIVDGTDAATGAVIVPLMPPTGCAGVLAMELPSGVEQREDVRAAATILAAQLSMLVSSPAFSRAASA
jgi:transcriptional regulator with XRE-family HTH domain